MKVSRRCPKCQGTRLLVTDLRVEVWVSAGAGTLGGRDRWYEEWACGRCGLVERYRLDAMPGKARVDAVVDSGGGEAPYR